MLSEEAQLQKVIYSRDYKNKSIQWQRITFAQ